MALKVACLEMHIFSEKGRLERQVEKRRERGKRVTGGGRDTYTHTHINIPLHTHTHQHTPTHTNTDSERALPPTAVKARDIDSEENPSAHSPYPTLLILMFTSHFNPHVQRSPLKLKPSTLKTNQQLRRRDMKWTWPKTWT